jgi:putative Mn2+ efflux pump MntP
MIFIFIFAAIGIYFIWRGIVFDKNKRDEKDDSALLDFGDGHFILFIFQLIVLGLLAFSGKFPNWVSKSVYIIIGLVFIGFSVALYFS